MILTLKQLTEKATSWSSNKVGLVTGCFDVLHLGHVELLKFAKENVDILIVGVESDKSVRINKGTNRPLFNQKARMEVIDNLKFPDYTILLTNNLPYTDSCIEDYFIDLTRSLKITHLITHEKADPNYSNKQSRADKLGIKLILQPGKKFSSSSKIIEQFGF